MDKRIYDTPRWRSLRKRILRRDKYICQYYLRYGRRVEATTVHHIYPVEEYPEYAYAPWNLISVSSKAHNLLHEFDGSLSEDGEKLRRRTQEQ